MFLRMPQFSSPTSKVCSWLLERLVFARSSEKNTPLILVGLTGAKEGFGSHPREPRNPSVREARKSCSNSLVANGVKCSETSVKQLSKKRPAVQKRATEERVHSGKTPNNGAVSRSERTSKNVDS